MSTTTSNTIHPTWCARTADCRPWADQREHTGHPVTVYAADADAVVDVRPVHREDVARGVDQGLDRVRVTLSDFTAETEVVVAVDLSADEVRALVAALGEASETIEGAQR